jgi:peroxiredoxin
MLETGALAPEFRLRDLDGQDRSLREILVAGPALFAFLKVSCPVCQFTFPFLERLYRQAGKAVVQFFAVSQDDEESTQEFHRECGVTFPTLLDEEQEGFLVSNAFGITNVPTAFLVEKDGAISWALDGFSKSELEALGRRLEVATFRSDESVPEWKGG